MSTIKINELATTDIALTDFIAKADVNGLMTKNTVSNLSAFFETVGEVGFKGSVLIADNPTQDGWYLAGEAGTFPNIGGLIALSESVTIFIISNSDTTYSKIDIPLTVNFDSTPTEGSTNAVRSGGIYSAIELNNPNNTIQKGIKNLQDRFDPLTVTIDKFVNSGSGNLQTRVGDTSSDFIKVFYGEQILIVGLTDTGYYGFYDKDKNHIIGGAYYSTTGVITVPDNSLYFRFSTQSLDITELQCLVSENIYYPKSLINETEINIKQSQIQNLKIQPKDTSFIEVITNLFDETTVNTGFFVNFIYGYLTSSVGKNSSAYIPVKEGYNLTLVSDGDASGYSWYKQKSNNFFQNVQGGSTWLKNTTKTVPSGVNWLRITILDNYLDDTQIFQGNDVGVDPVIPLNYMSYGDSEEYIKESLVIRNTNYKEFTRNAFVVNNSVDGYRLDVYSKNLVIDTSSSVSLEFIPVKEGDILSTTLDYAESAVIGNYYTDKNEDSYISGILFTEDSLIKTVPANARYIRTSCKTTNKFRKLVNINSTKLAYINGGEYFKDSLIYGFSSFYKNRKWCSDGDSITAQQQWQPLVVNKYGLDWTNIGIGGQKYSSDFGFWATSFDETDDIANDENNLNGTYHIPNDTEFVTLMGGVNDWGQDVALGNQDSTDTNTVMGGFNKYIDLYYAKFPTIPLIIMSPTLCYKASGIFVGWENNLGLTCYDYADAIEQRCRTLGVPYIDIIRNYGVTKVNQSIYTPDRVHPNNLGGEKISGVLMGYMNSIDNFNNGVITQELGYNIVGNGTFSDNSVWSVDDWTISNGEANITNSNGTQRLSQNCGIQIGKKYRIKYRLVNYVQGTASINLGGYHSVSRTSNGTYVDEIDVTNVSSNAFLYVDALSSFTGGIDYIEVQEIIE